MAATASMGATALSLSVIDGKPTTTSNDVARNFGKRHDHVIRDIRVLIEAMGGVPKIGGVVVFAETTFINPQNGETYPAYRITRDGFTLLAMGFTGKKALAFKLAYIDAFNAMEAELLAKTTRPANPAIDYDRISPAQAQTLKEIVHSLADAKVQGFGETWARLHNKFRVNSYLQLPAARFEEARAYLLGKLPGDHGDYANAFGPIPPTTMGPSFSAAIEQENDRIKSGLRIAHAAAVQLQTAMVLEMLKGGDGWKHKRWLTSLVTDSKFGSPPVVEQAAPDLRTLGELHVAIARGRLADKELLDLASAAAQRLYMQSCTDGPKGIAAQVKEVINRDLPQTDLREIVTSACLELWSRTADNSTVLALARV